MPQLYQDADGKKILFAQWFRCTGCHYCIEVCNRNALEISSSRNAKSARLPKMRERAICSFCKNCELICPHQAIYVVEDLHE